MTPSDNDTKLQPFGKGASFAGIVVLFFVLEFIGISAVIVTLLVVDFHLYSQNPRSFMRDVPQIAGAVATGTSIPALIYSVIIVTIGFRPNRPRRFTATLWLCVLLAPVFATLSLAIGSAVVAERSWADLRDIAAQNPQGFWTSVAVMETLAIGTGAISATIVNQFFKILRRRQIEAFDAES